MTRYRITLTPTDDTGPDTVAEGDAQYVTEKKWLLDHIIDTGWRRVATALAAALPKPHPQAAPVGTAMSAPDIVERLRVRGRAQDRSMIGQQMIEAADEIVRLRERLAAAEAVCATHDDLVRRDGSRVQCACSPHARWRELAGR